MKMQWKRSWQRMLALVLCAAMLMSLLPGLPLKVKAATPSGTGVPEELSYEIVNGEAIITDCDNSLTGELVIPVSIDGCPVTAIGDSAFGYCYQLTNVKIPNTVTKIGAYAFSDCYGLINVTLPESLTDIGEYAFSWCQNLVEVDIPGGVTVIKNRVFMGCSALRDVEISDGITTIEEYAFDGCCSLTSVVIPGSVTHIGDYIFAFCSGLTSITVAENNPYYCSDDCGAVYNKEKTQLLIVPAGYSGSYVIPEGVTVIGNGAFYYCGGLTDVIIPYGVTTIGDGAFSSCSGLTEVEIPDSVITIGNDAFNYCSGLTFMNIPASVTWIGSTAFYDCWQLKNIHFAGDAPGFGYAPFLYINDATVWYNVGTSGWEYVTSESLVGYSGSVYIQSISHVDYDADGICDYCGASLTEPEQPMPSDYYTISNGEVTITGCAPEASGELVIPSMLEGYPVTTIASYAFVSNQNITAVVIPSSVTTIGDYAFMGCGNLTELVMSEGLVSIGKGAFIDCYGLRDIIIPDSVTDIGKDAFKWCTGLYSVMFGSGVANIGQNAFYSCEALTAMYFKGNVPSFGTTPFAYVSNATLWYDCSAYGWEGVDAETLTGGNGSLVIWMAEHQDGDTDGICEKCGNPLVATQPVPEELSYEIVNGEAIITDCDRNFSGHMVIPVTIEGCPVTAIGTDAFYDCNSLTGITIPLGVTSIGGWAFAFCYDLTDVTIPDSVTYVGEYAFGWCESLTGINLPDSITDIGCYAFNGCYRLQEITIPAGVTVLKNDMFSDCSSLTSVTILGSVTQIESRVFSGCSGLTTIELPSGIVSIGDSAFNYCTNLTGVTISDTVNSIAENAFGGCGKLTSIRVSEDNPYYSSDANGVLYSKDQSLLVAMPAGFSGAYTIPDTVTAIGANAFYNCSGLTEIVIPDSVTSIGASAFYCCSGLTEITIPDSVTEIGEWAFYYCDGLTSVVIPDSVTVLGDYAFYCCRNLSSVKLSNKITAIGSNAFYYCSSLTSVTIPESVTSIGDCAFENCTALKNIYFTGDAPVFGDTSFWYVKNATFWYLTGTTGWGSVNVRNLAGNSTCMLQETEHTDTDVDGICDNCGTSLGEPTEPIPEGLYYAVIGEEVTVTGCAPEFVGELVIPSVIEGYPVTSIQYQAFFGHTGLTSVVVPETVTLIGSYAFMNCSNLTSVIIQGNVTIIGDYTFENCYSLISVTLPDSVTAIGNWAFCKCTKLTDIQIPEKVTYIGEGAFGWCAGLTELALPDSVTTIGKQAFNYCEGLTNITVPGSVTAIGASAFRDCTAVTALTICDGVTTVGDSAFYNCTGLTEVTIPGSVTNIGDYAFCCTGLTNVTFTGDAPGFGMGVFGETNATVWYPCDAWWWGNVNADSLGGGNGRITLTMIDHVDENSDGNCEICGKPLVEVPEGLLYEINNGEVTITGYDYHLPNELIIPPMIEGCPVTAIGDSAFLYNGNLTSVTICDTIRRIGQDAFYGCGSITEIIVSENNPYFTSSADGVLFNKDQTRLIQMPAAYEGAYTIPNSVTTIGRRAFAFCFGLMELTIPDGVTSIEYGAFICCERLTSLVIPDSVTEIQGSAFYSCVDLTSIDLSDNVTVIGENAFIYCDSLTSIVIPASVTTIGDGAFYDCTDLSEIYFEGDAPNFGGSLFNHDEYEDITLRRHCGADGWVSVNFELLSFNRGRIIVQKVHRYVDEQCTVCGAVDYDQPVPFGLMYEINNREVTITGYEMGISSELVIPEYIEGYPVVAIADYAFYRCEYLHNVVLPNRLTTIGEYAFANSNVNYVTLSDSVTSIGEYAFAQSSVYEVTLSAGLTEMGDYAFAWCNQLSRVIMPNGMTCIGDYAFVQCYYLSSINFPGSITEIGRHAFEGCGHLTSVTIPQGVASIGDYAFYECFGLESVSIPKSVTYIGIEAFSGCRMLTEIVVSENNTVYCSDVDGVLFTKDKTQLIQMPAGYIGTYTIPDTVSIIGDRAFYYSNITEVTIGSGVTYIGYHAFAYSALENIIFEGNPPMFSYAVFDYVNATLWFPCWATEWRNITSNDLHGGSGDISLQNKAHSFTNYVSNGDATCTQDGTKTAKCDYCDDIDIIIDVGSGGKHTLMFVPEVVSCTEPGNIVHYRCEGCGKLFADGTALVELTAAEVWKAPVGHTEVVDPAVEPGCMTDGLTEGKHCCVCGTVLVPQIPIGSLGHSYEPQVVLPTYFEQGYTLHICSVCGDSYKDTYVEALQRVELSQAELKLEYTSAYYQGRPLTPGVTLTYQGDVLDAYKELKLTYVNNDKVGVATVTVEGINQFVGTVQLTFEISYEVIPQPIVNVFAVGEIGKISLSWGQSSEVNTDSYHIYRKSQDEAEYRLITTIYGREILSYEDRNVEREKTYSYYVTGVGLYGAEGEPSQVVMATVQVDKTAPTVLKINPAAASVIAGSTQLSVVARDNVAVTRVAYFYSVDNGETWISIGETSNSGFGIVFDTSVLEGASVKVKALAYDAEGNESEPRTVAYSLDNVGPEKVTGLSAVTLSSKITLSWKDVDANDAAYFILQTQTQDGWKTLASNIKTLGYTITGLQGDTDYTYRVACVDTHGNLGEYSDAFTARTAADVTAPVITHQSPNAARFNQSISFSATAKDDCDIATIAIQVSRDLNSWATVSTKTFTDRAFAQSYTYTIDLGGYADGSLFVRAIATDFAGNVSDTGSDAPYTEYFVDRTAPKAPADVAATGNDGYITISWSMGSEADLGKYVVCRATEPEGEYRVIASNLSSLNYHDRDVTRDSRYYYKVAVSDGCGNVSGYSEVVTATMSQDTRKPEITGISTTYQQKISPSSHKIYVAATDNNQLSKLIVEYCTSVNPQYKLLAMEENIGASSKSIPVELPIEGLNHGDVLYLRAYAVDVAGLRSDNQTTKYTLDLTAPQAEGFAAVIEGSVVTLTWKDQAEDDLSGFKVYRSVEGGSFRLLGSRGANSTGSYTFVDTITAKESTTYVYKLEAMDRMGNTASWQKTVNYVYVETEEAPEEYVNQAPIPQMTLPGYMTLEVEEIFDASGSVDDIGIVAYLWDFGDGTYSTSMKPIKSYAVAGTYIVKLSVTDTEGCVSTVTDTVEVKPRDLLGLLNVKVVDENGKALSYVPVYFDLGSENQKIIYTNGQGEATLKLPGGTHTVGMYAAGYLPVKKDVVVLANATRNVTLTTVEEDIVTGHFEITRMTFEEIKAAGIDVYDPANQNVYSATVRVTYGSSAPLTIDYVRNDHEILDFTVKDSEGTPVKEYVSSNGEVRKITGVTYIPSKPVNNSTPGTGTATQPDVVAIVDIPASASYLKEFFDVRLHIINNASPEFVLENNEVVLNVPDGMTLMNSVTGGYKTSNTVQISSIKGQETVTLAWVLRGDRAGEYGLSADFTGTLAEFNEVVTAYFETEEPIKVYGLEGVKFRILAADEVHNDTLYFNIELENQRDIDIYMPAIGLTDKIMNMTESVLNNNASGDFNVDAYILNAYVQTGSGSKLYQPVTMDPNGRAETPVKVLAPGQKLVIEYVAYNAVNYNGVAYFQEAAIVEFEGLLENIETGSFHKELYSLKDYSDKLENILSGTAADAKDYIVNNGNFYYVGEAEKISDTALKNLYKITNTVLEGDLSALTQDEERDLIQRVLLTVLSHESVTSLSEDFIMNKYDQAVISMIDKVKIGTINSFVGDGITGENIAEAFANIAKDSAELAAVYRDKGADAFNKELSQRVAGAGLGITIDAGAMLALGGEAEAFSSVLDGGKDIIKSMFTAAQESEKEALYFAVLKYQCNAEIAEIILDAVIDNTEDCLMEELNGAILAGLLPAGAGILALRDVGLGEKTLIYQTAKDMKKTLESDRESFYGSVQDVLNYVEDGAAAAASIAIKALTKSAMGSTPMAIASAGFKIVDTVTGWGSYVKQEDAMEVYKACSDAFLGAYRDSVATRNEESDFYSMTYLRALCEIRLLGESQYKAFVDDYLKGVHVAPVSEEKVIKEINKEKNTNYTSVEEWWDAVQYNAVHARDVMFNLEGIVENEIPRAPVVALDYERLQTVHTYSSAYEYCFGDGVWKTCENAPIAFEVGLTPSTLRVRQAATADTLAGKITTVKIYARKDLSKLINVRFDGRNYYIRNLSNAYYYQVFFTNNPEEIPNWSLAQQITGSDEVVIESVGAYDYMVIRSCQNADRQETTSNPLTCTVQTKQKLNLEIQGRGSVFQTERTGYYFLGDTIDLVAMPVADTVFRGWFIDGILVSVDSHYLLEMSEGLQIQAVFEGSGVRDVVIGKLPEQLEYRLGETLNLDGLEVLVTYEDGTTMETQHYTAALMSTAVGTTEVEIAFGQKTVRYGVTILCGTPTENDPLGHTVVEDAAVDATCTSTGLTKGQHCSVCHEILVEQEVVPVKKHTYKWGICTVCGAEDPDYVMPTKVNGLTVSDVTRNAFTLTWDALDDGITYWVCVDGKTYASTTATTMTVTKRQPGVTYNVAVIAKIRDTFLSLADADVLSVITDAYSYTHTADADIYGVTVDWQAQGGTKAWLYCGTDPENMKPSTSSTDGKLILMGLKSNTTYYFQIAYLIGEVKDSSGKITTFGEVVYGDVFQVTTRRDEQLDVTKNGNQLTWNKVGASQKYWVTVTLDDKSYLYSTTETRFTLTRFTAEQLKRAAITVRGWNGTEMFDYNPVSE